MKDFQNFAASWACPSIQKWHPQKWLDQFVALMVMFLKQKKTITPIVFEILNI